MYHVHETPLPAGTLIPPGRWGAKVLSGGKSHPFFFREHLLEIWRREKTAIGVSRLCCTFAFEDLQQARGWASNGAHVHSVAPVNVDAATARLDMLWLTWMAEPQSTTDQVMEWCAGYWAGRAAGDLKLGATSQWEWLFGCPLKVIDRIERT